MDFMRYYVEAAYSIMESQLPLLSADTSYFSDVLRVIAPENEDTLTAIHDAIIAILALSPPTPDTLWPLERMSEYVDWLKSKRRRETKNQKPKEN